MTTYFDRLNEQTKAWNNGYGERKIGWYNVTGVYNKTTVSSKERKGHYDGRGCWVED